MICTHLYFWRIWIKSQRYHIFGHFFKSICFSRWRFSVMNNFDKVFSLVVIWLVAWLWRKIDCFISSQFLTNLVNPLAMEFKNKLLAEVIREIKCIVKALLQQQTFPNQNLVTSMCRILAVSLCRKIVQFSSCNG